MAAVGAFASVSYAQFTMTITGPGYSSVTAPSGSFTVSATASATISKVVFYRNDVPYETDTTSPYQLSQNLLGQETYTYRARGYDSSGAWADSAEVKLTVITPRVFVMGESIPHPGPAPTPSPTPTSGPDRLHDHTAEIQAAVDYLSGLGGGTLFFPCKLPPNPWNPAILDTVAVYNISDTINVPPNVTLQGESAEEGGRCRIYWTDVTWHPDPVPTPTPTPGPADPDPDPTPTPNYCHDNASTHDLTGKPMFRIAGGVSGVRFRDLWLYSRSSGENCYPRYDWDRIDDEGTTGVEMNAVSGGDVKDIIFENVSVSNFTRGVSAVSNNLSAYGVFDVKMRGYRPVGNHRQLYINDKYAHDWDVQNVNITAMYETQGGIEIVNAGKPPEYSGMLGELKFLQVNCAANRAAPPDFCVEVQKHGGLYFRQLHHEGVPRALSVLDISGRHGPNTNEDPIVYEGGVASGKFYDPSMKLYLIGNNIQAPDAIGNFLDDARLRFIDAGVNSTLVDCGDVHTDWTDVQEDGNPTDPTTGEDLKMLFSHAERNRASFYAVDSGVSYIKKHTYCPADIGEFGGEYFDNGVLPTVAGGSDTPKLYSNIMDSSTCPSGNAYTCLTNIFPLGGSVYIDGTFTSNQPINIPRGMQITGSSTGVLQFVNTSPPSTDKALLRIKVPVSSTDPMGTSGIVIRDLKLITANAGITGIDMVGQNHSDVGVGRDIHLSGLTIEGFNIGLYGGPFDATTGQPMIDGTSLKHLSFVNNKTAVSILSGNIALWNVMNLSVSANIDEAVGWSQTFGGHQDLQGVTCTGTSKNPVKDCINVSMNGAFYLTGLRQTTNVTNALTVGVSGPVGSGIYSSVLHTNLLVRNNDFTPTDVDDAGGVRIQGKAYITSIGNNYQDIDVESSDAQGQFSRLTYCGDTYPGVPYGSGLEDVHPNLWTWVPTPTRVECGSRPIPWDDALWLGGETGDLPMVGNFYDDVREDFVIYRPGSQSQFLIRKAPNGMEHEEFDWGTTGDIPLIGRFFHDTRAQLVVFRPSTGAWWIKDPLDSGNDVVLGWGTTDDVPFVGNFFDESGPVKGNHEEIGIYRPGNGQFWIENPRTIGTLSVFTTGAPSDSTIQVGDFQGLMHDQIAQFKDGSWVIVDPQSPASPLTISFGTTHDVPVVGKYLSSGLSCVQLGVWRPGTQEFIVRNAVSACGSTTPVSMTWGSNNDFQSSSYCDDIPLTINTDDGSLDRPVAYRPTKGAFHAGIANGQWWVHDPF